MLVNKMCSYFITKLREQQKQMLVICFNNDIYLHVSNNNSFKAISIISQMDIFDRMNIKPINLLTVAEGVSTNLSNLLLLISCAT